MGTDLTPAPLTATGLFVRVLADADGRTVIALDPAATVALAAILDAVPVTTVLTDLGLDPATALTAADVVTALTAGLAPLPVRRRPVNGSYESATLCRHCEQPIEFDGQRWLHVCGSQTWDGCGNVARTRAEPAAIR